MDAFHVLGYFMSPPDRSSNPVVEPFLDRGR
jgi:hypothetical protein